MTAATHRVLNNNAVVSTDDAGVERVLLGSGLGFQLKNDGLLDLSRVEKSFVLEANAEGDRARTVLAETPYAVVESVVKAVDVAERQLGRALGRRFVIAVIDHVQYLRERVQQGLRIPAAPMPELRVLYPDEFAAATAMATSLEGSLDTPLPAEESVFLTMHLINTTRNAPNGTAALLLRRLQHVVQTVERELGVELDTESASYARFILHIQFLLQRLASRAMLRSDDGSFFEFAKHSYPRAFAVAEHVRAYLSEATTSELTDEEVLFITVHVARLEQQVGLPEGDDGLVG